MRLVGAIVRASVSVPALVVLVVGTFAGIVVQRPIAVPLTDTAERLWPVACLVALPTAVWLHEVGGRWLEAAAGCARRARTALVIAVAVAAVASVAGGVLVTAVGGGAAHAAEVGRNFGLVLGVSLLMERTPIGEVGWAPGLLGVMWCWVLGTSPVGLAPAPWALTLQPIGDSAAAIVSAVVFAAGVAVYVSGRSS